MNLTVMLSLFFFTGLQAPADETATLIDALDGKDEAEGDRAAHKLEGLGEKAVPALAEALRRGSVVKRIRASHILDRIGKVESVIPALIAAVADENEHVRRNAANALGRAGAAAREAVGALMEAARRPDLDLRRNALRSLSMIGNGASAAFPLFVEALDDEDFLVRRTAIEGLVRTGRPANEAAPHLVRMLGDGHEDVPYRAVVALSALGPPAVPFLVGALGHKQAAVRRGAAESLGRLAAKGKDAVPALAAALKDNAPQVRAESARALRAMGPSAAAAAPALTQALADKESAVHAAAALVMVEPGKKAELVPILAGLLGSTDPYTRGVAARTLGEVGPAAKDAAPALRKLLADKTHYFDPRGEPTVGGTAAEAILKITGSREN